MGHHLLGERPHRLQHQLLLAGLAGLLQEVVERQQSAEVVRPSIQPDVGAAVEVDLHAPFAHGTIALRPPRTAWLSIGRRRDAEYALHVVTGVLAYTAAQAEAFEKLDLYYGDFFGNPTTKYGLRPSAITDASQIKQLTAFFSWSAWTASTLRPNLTYSYTNNWPPEPLVANHVTADAVVWSVLSLIALLGGIGLLLAAFGRWNFLGWHGREDQRVSFRPPDEVALTPAQRSCAWFFLVMALLFTLQALLGGATQHYRAEIANFFGFDLARILPFNIARTWHLQLAIFWVSTSFLAAGIFLAPMITGREPRRQNWLSYALLVALAIVVFGSLAGERAFFDDLDNAEYQQTNCEDAQCKFSAQPTGNRAIGTKPAWSSEAPIDERGLFTAPDRAGVYFVKAAIGELTATTKITVKPGAPKTVRVLPASAAELEGLAYGAGWCYRPG